MARTAVRFLLSVMQSGGVWRYTCSPNPDYLPPDVDDTAIISSLLHRHGVAVPENTHVLLGNRASSGLFHTWILPRFTRGASMSYWAVALRQLLKLPQLFWFFRATECKPNDVDPVVNANVLHYLGERPETRPIIANLIRILAEQKEDTCDKYYGGRFTFYYFLSRNHAAGIGGFESVADTIVGRIKAHAHAGGVIGDHILHTALAACTLMDWQDYSAVLDNAILAILQARTSGGAWQKCPFYFSGWMKKLGWGSEELTTGFCLEALARYRLLQTHGD